MRILTDQSYMERSNYLDIVFCIDCTGSMIHSLENFKVMCSHLYDSITEQTENMFMILKKCRIRIIAFSNIPSDEENALQDSGFFVLPDENESFLSFVKLLTIQGKGSQKEGCGLKALALAMASNWQEHEFNSKVKNTYRHLIVLATDAPAHNLGQVDTVEKLYSNNILLDYEELIDNWEGNMPKGKKLIMFAPESELWCKIFENISGCIYVPLYDRDSISFNCEDFVNFIY